MKYLSLLFVATVFFAGCAQEAYYVDQEFGIATMDAFDRQVVHKDYAHADKSVDGMEGLHAEPTMQMYHDSFGDGFTQQSVSTTDPGL